MLMHVFTLRALPVVPRLSHGRRRLPVVDVTEGNIFP